VDRLEISLARPGSTRSTAGSPVRRTKRKMVSERRRREITA
jgi:hypothetical protein